MHLSGVNDSRNRGYGILIHQDSESGALIGDCHWKGALFGVGFFDTSLTHLMIELSHSSANAQRMRTSQHGIVSDHKTIHSMYPSTLSAAMDWLQISPAYMGVI